MSLEPCGLDMSQVRARKLAQGDYLLLKTVLEKHHKKLVRSKRKLWFKYINVDKCLRFFYQCEHAYIVDDTYLVIYDIINPFYADEGITYIQEVIVLRLVAGADFSAVTTFLERSRVEAGAVAIGAGTALARNDRALASLYQQEGYEVCTLLLMKEPHG